MGSDTGLPAVAPTSAAGLVLTGSSVDLWNTTASIALRDTKHRVRGLEVVFWVKIRLKLISYQPAVLLIWKRGECKLVMVGLIFHFVGS